ASHSAPLPPPTPTLSPYTTLFRSKKPNTAYPPVSHPHPGKSARSASPVSLDPVSGAMLAQWPGRYPPPTPSDRSTQPNPRSAHRSEEHTSELQSRENIVCRLLLEK